MSRGPPNFDDHFIAIQPLSRGHAWCQKIHRVFLFKLVPTILVKVAGIWAHFSVIYGLSAIFRPIGDDLRSNDPEFVLVMKSDF